MFGSGGAITCSAITNLLPAIQPCETNGGGLQRWTHHAKHAIPPPAPPPTTSVHPQAVGMH